MDKESGILAVLVERLEKQRLPRILRLKEKVDGGQRLNNSDLDFLERVMDDARETLPLVSKHPEYQALASKLIDLYNEITEKGLQLEKNS